MIFFPFMKQHGLAGFIVWKCIVSISRFLLMYLFASISKFLQRPPTRIQKKRTHDSILPTFFLSRTIFTSSLVALLAQQGGIFSNSREQWSKPCCGFLLLPTEMGIIIMPLHCYCYLLCDLLLRWWSDHFQKVISCWCLFHQLGDPNNQKSKLSSQLEQKSHLVELNTPCFGIPICLPLKPSQPENRRALNALNPTKKKPPAAPVFRGLIGIAAGARSKQCLQQLLREFRGVEGSEGVEGGEGGGMDGSPGQLGCQFYTLRVYRYLWKVQVPG